MPQGPDFWRWELLLALGLEKGFALVFRLGPKPELYSHPIEALDCRKPKTVGLRQDKSQELLEFGLF